MSEEQDPASFPDDRYGGRLYSPRSSTEHVQIQNGRLSPVFHYGPLDFQEHQRYSQQLENPRLLGLQSMPAYQNSPRSSIGHVQNQDGRLSPDFRYSSLDFEEYQRHSQHAQNRHLIGLQSIPSLGQVQNQDGRLSPMHHYSHVDFQEYRRHSQPSMSAYQNSPIGQAQNHDGRMSPVYYYGPVDFQEHQRLSQQSMPTYPNSPRSSTGHVQVQNQDGRMSPVYHYGPLDLQEYQRHSQQIQNQHLIGLQSISAYQSSPSTSPVHVQNQDGRFSPVNNYGPIDFQEYQRHSLQMENQHLIGLQSMPAYQNQDGRFSPVNHYGPLDFQEYQRHSQQMEKQHLGLQNMPNDQYDQEMSIPDDQNDQEMSIEPEENQHYDQFVDDNKDQEMSYEQEDSLQQGNLADDAKDLDMTWEQEEINLADYNKDLEMSYEEVEDQVQQSDYLNSRHSIDQPVHHVQLEHQHDDGQVSFHKNHLIDALEEQVVSSEKLELNEQNVISHDDQNSRYSIDQPVQHSDSEQQHNVDQGSFHKKLMLDGFEEQAESSEKLELNQRNVLPHDDRNSRHSLDQPVQDAQLEHQDDGGQVSFNNNRLIDALEEQLVSSEKLELNQQDVLSHKDQNSRHSIDQPVYNEPINHQHEEDPVPFHMNHLTYNREEQEMFNGQEEDQHDIFSLDDQNSRHSIDLPGHHEQLDHQHEEDKVPFHMNHLTDNREEQDMFNGQEEDQQDMFSLDDQKSRLSIDQPGHHEQFDHQHVEDQAPFHQNQLTDNHEEQKMFKSQEEDQQDIFPLDDQNARISIDQPGHNEQPENQLDAYQASSFYKHYLIDDLEEQGISKNHLDEVSSEQLESSQHSVISYDVQGQHGHLEHEHGYPHVLHHENNLLYEGEKQEMPSHQIEPEHELLDHQQDDLHVFYHDNHVTDDHEDQVISRDDLEEEMTSHQIEPEDELLEHQQYDHQVSYGKRDNEVADDHEEHEEEMQPEHQQDDHQVFYHDNHITDDPKEHVISRDGHEQVSNLEDVFSRDDGQVTFHSNDLANDDEQELLNEQELFNEQEEYRPDVFPHDDQNAYHFHNNPVYPFHDSYLTDDHEDHEASSEEVENQQDHPGYHEQLENQYDEYRVSLNEQVESQHDQSGYHEQLGDQYDEYPVSLNKEMENQSGYRVSLNEQVENQQLDQPGYDDQLENQYDEHRASLTVEVDSQQDQPGYDEELENQYDEHRVSLSEGVDNQQDQPGYDEELENEYDEHRDSLNEQVENQQLDQPGYDDQLENQYDEHRASLTVEVDSQQDQPGYNEELENQYDEHRVSLSEDVDNQQDQPGYDEELENEYDEHRDSLNDQVENQQDHAWYDEHLENEYDQYRVSLNEQIENQQDFISLDNDNEKHSACVFQCQSSCDDYENQVAGSQCDDGDTQCQFQEVFFKKVDYLINPEQSLKQVDEKYDDCVFECRRAYDVRLLNQYDDCDTQDTQISFEQLKNRRYASLSEDPSDQEVTFKQVDYLINSKLAFNQVDQKHGVPAYQHDHDTQHEQASNEKTSFKSGDLKDQQVGIRKVAYLIDRKESLKQVDEKHRPSVLQCYPSHIPMIQHSTSQGVSFKHLDYHTYPKVPHNLVDEKRDGSLLLDKHEEHQKEDSLPDKSHAGHVTQEHNKKQDKDTLPGGSGIVRKHDEIQKGDSLPDESCSKDGTREHGKTTQKDDALPNPDKDSLPDRDKEKTQKGNALPNRDKDSLPKDNALPDRDKEKTQKGNVLPNRDKDSLPKDNALPDRDEDSSPAVRSKGNEKDNPLPAFQDKQMSLNLEFPHRFLPQIVFIDPSSSDGHHIKMINARREEFSILTSKEKISMLDNLYGAMIIQWKTEHQAPNKEQAWNPYLVFSTIEAAMQGKAKLNDFLKNKDAIQRQLVCSEAMCELMLSFPADELVPMEFLNVISGFKTHQNSQGCSNSLKALQDEDSEHFWETLKHHAIHINMHHLTPTEHIASIFTIILLPESRFREVPAECDKIRLNFKNFIIQILHESYPRNRTNSIQSKLNQSEAPIEHELPPSCTCRLFAPCLPWGMTKCKCCKTRTRE